MRPNPFRAEAEVEFTLASAGRADLRVYDVLGREVRSLLRGERLAAGPQRASWDGRRNDGGAAGAGVYFVRLELAGRSWTRAVVRVR